MPRNPKAEVAYLAGVAAQDGDLGRLADRVLLLPTAEKLRLAAAFLDLDKRELAMVLAERATQELQVRALFRATEGGQQS